MSWTDERVELLEKLWGEGKTAAEIARELGDVTRNAVIGKAHRLKLSNRISPIQQNNKKAAKPVGGKVVARSVSNTNTKAEPPKIKIKKVKLADLSAKMCRWPFGDPQSEDFHFCGCDSADGVPYCADHAKMAYQTTSRARTLQAKDFDNVDGNVKKAATVS